jgi:syntaxin 16
MLEMSSLPPQWMDCAEEAREDLKNIRDKIVQLKKAQQGRILKVFGDDAAPDKETEAIASQISQLVRRCEQSIHQVKVKGAGPGGSGHDTEIRQNVQRNLATELQQLSQQFRQAQKEYLNEIRKRQRDTVWDDAQRSNNGKGADVGFNDSQTLELEHMEIQAGQRSSEICQIASSINDLHTVFKELAVLVIDQGTVLDRIDYNIEQVVVQSREANVQLQKAEKSQKSNRAMKCIMMLVAVNLVLILILIIKARH